MIKSARNYGNKIKSVTFVSLNKKQEEKTMSMENKTYFPRPERTPNIPVPAGMNLEWNSNTGHWAFRPIPGYSTVHLKKDSFIPKRHVTSENLETVTNTNSENSNLHKAKREKNDEFYTRLPDIVNELKHYKDHFKDKVVYCPCDKAFNLGRSNFVQFFIEHFLDWGIKKLVATQYNEEGRGWKWVVERGDVNRNGYIDESEIDTYQLIGNGDFASDECKKIMAECDIVVTNPPFSLFRPFVDQIMSFGKKFLIIGNKNALTYKEIFMLIKDNKMWLGYTVPEDFDQPEGFEKKSLKGLTRWFTNLMHDKRKEGIYCPQRYTGREDKYPVYDNYDAIEIGHYTKNGKWEGSLDELPYDYDGVMGVPITFLDQYNPEQFEILGFMDRKDDVGGLKTKTYTYLDADNYNDLNRGGAIWLNGKLKNTYMRIFIRRKK